MFIELEASLANLFTLMKQGLGHAWLSSENLPKQVTKYRSGVLLVFVAIVEIYRIDRKLDTLFRRYDGLLVFLLPQILGRNSCHACLSCTGNTGTPQDLTLPSAPVPELRGI